MRLLPQWIWVQQEARVCSSGRLQWFGYRKHSNIFKHTAKKIVRHLWTRCFSRSIVGFEAGWFLSAFLLLSSLAWWFASSDHGVPPERAMDSCPLVSKCGQWQVTSWHGAAWCNMVQKCHRSAQRFSQARCGMLSYKYQAAANVCSAVNTDTFCFRSFTSTWAPWSRSSLQHASKSSEVDKERWRDIESDTVTDQSSNMFQ